MSLAKTIFNDLLREHPELVSIDATYRYFDRQEDAAIAYDNAAIQLHGKFANINFSCPADKCDPARSGGCTFADGLDTCT